jgi:transaldolase
MRPAADARARGALHREHDARRLLENFYDHGEVGRLLPRDGGDADALLKRFADAGVDVAALAAQLQSDGAKSFVTSWNELIARISSQSTSLK